MQMIGRELLDGLSAQARAAPRRRKNFNVHHSEKEPCNRLLNALEPDTYIQPHCHSEPAKDETMVIVRGRLGLVAFDGAGQVAGTALLEAGGESVAVTIPHGVFHALVALAPGTIFFEAKAGPYRPLAPHEKAAWAPAEGDPAAPAQLARLKKLF
ncbi:MAG: WbuC family cupin fold metalloprotein [Kiritimatiellaeota bacterium]|nr:WbuC family cupin fold metalloprotein [Kiritimatiellota bacterium]